MHQLSNLDKYRYLCKDLPSPENVIDFNFYFLISSALARKVWIGAEGGWQLYPNLYLMFIGSPGVGKTMPAKKTHEILSNLTKLRQNTDGTFTLEQLVNLAPDTTSWEKLILVASSSGFTCPRIDDPKKTTYYHASTCFCLGDEVGTLFRRNTEDIVTFLVKSWDCGEYKNDTLKHGLTHIRNICVNFLGCTTPEKMGRLLNSGLLDDGFTGRVIFIYADKSRKTKAIIDFTEDQRQIEKDLTTYVKNLALLPAGEVKLTSAAGEWIEDWHNKEQNDNRVRHERIQDYYARKKAHILKLAISYHFARSLEYTIDAEDLEGAKDMLEKCEVLMPEALACGGKNPLSQLSDAILKRIARGPISRGKILIDFWKDGNESEIADAIRFLESSGMIEPCVVDGGKAGLQMRNINKET